MQLIGYRYQRTLGRAVDVAGTGFISGQAVRARLRPAPANTGVAFVRSDRPGSPRTVALAANVTDTRRRTTIGSANDGVTLVEHVLAALAGLRVDNCTIELNGPEPPGLDGSARGFVEAIHQAGVLTQNVRRPIVTVSSPVVVTKDGASVSIHPADTGLRISYILDYGYHSPIPRQTATVEVTPETFAQTIANCRTFLLEAEATALRAQGIGRNVNVQDLLVFGPQGLIGNQLRSADEPARHKILDLVGDLSLSGFDLAGHVVAYRSGHSLNVELAKQILAREGTATAPAVLSFPARRRAA
ncbi:UDP-3-O-acyl-N-acetylglucosamine deacetylase [Limnoglobus roseus]|uniref:UDP-3-O-acyl-N-acetylglucosamine deacetylase n=1 Tax=Limnoglobus roseus TaxID=2598579 RepID=A0A5C1ANE6_9BACT|nr:UDP-3-O-acyl-N-acetylglucosamine deacetylase [Limnoglobus roseus]QEL20085.1 UDP-3-O-acyl N-acetylglucosamine deacetylase [Limnoglobus roseus]